MILIELIAEFIDSVGRANVPANDSRCCLKKKKIQVIKHKDGLSLRKAFFPFERCKFQIDNMW